ncbi:MAG: septal ring lytic transglycosylase RlpA family protein, partial [Treponema sp.]|nr:septal ring lytic transglycosylase RlpA family protein [Treponema sp.]
MRYAFFIGKSLKNEVLRDIFFIILSLILLTGATDWEGAAAVAPAGDLPDTGYYAATNSFPRNTVVDITNLENGKSIRVIVASGLETPGLLAVLSRNAAETIGLVSRSVGRIRISQTSDPIAFSRFPGGDPDFDSRGIDESVYRSGPESGFFPESEWADDREIVDIPDINTYEESLVYTEYCEPDFTEPAVIAAPPVEPFVTEYINDAEYVGKIEGLVIPAYTDDAGPPPHTEAQAYTGIQEERYDYTLMPAEERPPNNPQILMDESLFIPGIAAVPQNT